MWGIVSTLRRSLPSILSLQLALIERIDVHLGNKHATPLNYCLIIIEAFSSREGGANLEFLLVVYWDGWNCVYEGVEFML